jgi:hypothetical protein
MKDKEKTIRFHLNFKRFILSYQFLSINNTFHKIWFIIPFQEEISELPSSAWEIFEWLKKLVKTQRREIWATQCSLFRSSRFIKKLRLKFLSWIIEYKRLSKWEKNINFHHHYQRGMESSVQTISGEIDTFLIEIKSAYL